MTKCKFNSFFSFLCSTFIVVCQYYFDIYNKWKLFSYFSAPESFVFFSIKVQRSEKAEEKVPE